MRATEIIDADIETTERRLVELRDERKASIAATREAMVKAFDDGASREQIMEAFGVTYSALAGILHLAGRNERQRRTLRLPVEKRPHYNRLVAQGLPSRMALQIAEGLS